MKNVNRSVNQFGSRRLFHITKYHIFVWREKSNGVFECEPELGGLDRAPRRIINDFWLIAICDCRARINRHSIDRTRKTRDRRWKGTETATEKKTMELPI